MSKKRPLISQVIPSMFHRRLMLLAAVAASLVAVLAIQLAWLTVVEGSVWRQKAGATLVQRRLIPTARGKILDRQMRVLAVDKPSYDVCVRYPVLTGEWAYRQARRDAYRANRHQWSQLDQLDRDRLTAECQRPYEVQVQRLWQTLCALGQIDRTELEKRKGTVIRRVKQVASAVWDRRLRLRLEEQAQDGSVTLGDVAQPIWEQTAAHALLINVTGSALIRAQSLIAQAAQEGTVAVWRQVTVEASRHRRYPFETMTVMLDRSTLPTPLRQSVPLEATVQGVGLHIVGALRDVWQEDVQRRPYRTRDGEGRPRIDRGGYLPGDHTGYWGIEKSQENRLRGVRGQVVTRLDTQRQARHEPKPGGDVVLTVDVQLQARIQAMMSPGVGLMKVQPWHAGDPPSDPLQPQPGQPLNGAVVVLDVAQSHVLAAVSVPTFSRSQLADRPDSIWRNKVDQPFLNRPIARAYQPGSIVKPLVLAAAVTDGKIGDGQTVACTGHLDPHFKDRYRCWIYKHYQATHGLLNGPDAIAHSCNIFFYTMGRRFGAAGLVSWYQQMGLGAASGCGLGEEINGDLPDLDRAGDSSAVGFSVADAMFMAIGQGPVRWTPLQAANAYAALARGGYVISPTVVMVGQSDAQATVDLGLNAHGVEMAMRGLEDAVSQRYGTVRSLALLDHELIFNVPGVHIYGKSGTAQGVPLWVDENQDGRFTKGIDRLARRGDHAWVVCLLKRQGSTRPDFVVAVVVEYGGSGGVVAGPIANQVIHAMRDEGYL